MTGPDPHPIDDIAAIATRYGLVAKQIVNDTVQVATDAFDQINAPTPNYTTGDAITTMGRLVNIAMTGGLSLARVAFEVNPDPRVLLVADNIADSVSSAVSDVIDVAKDAAVQASTLDSKQTKEESVNWAIRLTSIAALRGAEILETAVAGPGQYGALVSTYHINFATAPPAEVTLSAVSLARPGDPNNISALVVFESKKVPAGAQNFTISINTAGLPSAKYDLNVRLTEADGSSTTQAYSILIPNSP
jgi:hypothetical protein